MVHKVDISYKTVVFAVFFVIGLWFLYLIKDIILSLFVAFILMSALRPFVEKLEKYRVPRGLSIGIIYILVIFIISFIGSVIFPPLVNETTKLFKTISPVGGLPIFYQEILNFFKNLNFDAFTKISPYSGNVMDLVRTIIAIFDSIVSTLGLFVFTFYLLLERKYLSNILGSFLGEASAKRGVEIVTRVEDRLGSWVRGQILLCLAVGILSFIGLTILNIPYALPLALIAAILEIVPIIGPIISGIPAVLIALATSPGMALIVVLLYFIIQQIENNLIVPNVFNKIVGLRPVLTIIALMIGGKLMGIGGVILSIPTVLVIQTIIQEVIKDRAK